MRGDDVKGGDAGSTERTLDAIEHIATITPQAQRTTSLQVASHAITSRRARGAEGGVAAAAVRAGFTPCAVRGCVV